MFAGWLAHGSPLPPSALFFAEMLYGLVSTPLLPSFSSTLVLETVLVLALGGLANHGEYGYSLLLLILPLHRILHGS